MSAMPTRAPSHRPGRLALPERRSDPMSRRHYGTRHWRRLRRLILSGEPLCRECEREGRLTLATQVDHIVPRDRGGADDDANLQPLCQSCHSRKTATEDGGFGRRK